MALIELDLEATFVEIITGAPAGRVQVPRALGLFAAGSPRRLAVLASRFAPKSPSEIRAGVRILEALSGDIPIFNEHRHTKHSEPIEGPNRVIPFGYPAPGDPPRNIVLYLQDVK